MAGGGGTGRDEGMGMRYLFILLCLSAACAESPVGPTWGTAGIHPAKGANHRPSGEPAPPSPDPQRREYSIELDGIPLVDEAMLDDAAASDLEQSMRDVNADFDEWQQQMAVTRSLGRISVTRYPLAD